jgi:hypothetical protein
MDYDSGCSGCRISQGLISKPGGLLKLPGDWVANQYAGGEGYLGWLALQPRFHRMELGQLSTTELECLGPNISSLDGGLRAYWRLQYPSDPVEKVYVVYFFESPNEDPPPNERFHLHIHVIPRFKSLDHFLRCQPTGPTWPDGWEVAKLTKAGKVSEPYQRTSPMWEKRAESLMSFLKHELAARP